MTKARLKQFAKKAEVTQARISEFTPKQKAALEKRWDVEHAYYSNTLEGSRIDRKEFENLAKRVD